MEVTEPLGPNEEAWRTERGVLRIRRPRPDVIVFVESGHLDDEFAPLIARASNEALKSGAPLHFFVDAYDLTGYAPSIRKGPTDWLNKNRSRVAIQHMLVRSKLTKMGLSVASLALGGLLRGYSARSEFRQALDQTIRTLNRSDDAASIDKHLFNNEDTEVPNGSKSIA